MITAKIRQRMYVIIAISVGVVAIALVTALTLKSFVPQPSEQSSVDEVVVAPADIVVALKNSAAVPALSHYMIQDNPEGVSGLVYRLQNQPYDVYVGSRDFVLYSTPDQAEPFDFQATTAQVSTLMSSHGLQQSAADTTKDAPAVTYTGHGVVCRLAGGVQPNYYTFVCISVSQIEAEYAAVTNLVNLYKKSVPTDQLTFTLAIRTLTQQDPMQAAVLSLSSADNTTKPRTLLFAATDGAWEYVADINSGTVSNGKYAVSPEARAAINSSKYGDFLLSQFPLD